MARKVESLGAGSYLDASETATEGAENSDASETATDFHLRHEIQNDEIIRQFCEKYNVWDSMTFAPYVQFLWRAYTNALGKQSEHP